MWCGCAGGRDSQGFSYPGGFWVGYNRVGVQVSILEPLLNPYPKEGSTGFLRVFQIWTSQLIWLR